MKQMIAIASMMVTSMAFATTPAVTPTTSVPASAAKTAVITPASTVQTPAKPKVLTAQQQKMVDCNKQATGKKGDERKAFMSACLKKAPTPASTAAGAPVAVQPASAPQTTATPVVPVKK